MDWFFKLIVKVTRIFFKPKLKQGISKKSESIESKTEDLSFNGLKDNTNEIAPVLVSERYELFLQLVKLILDTDNDHSENLKIVSIEHCQVRISVDGLVSSEHRFLGVNKYGCIELIMPNGDIAHNYESLNELAIWLIT